MAAKVNKALQTRQKLLDSARDLFSVDWYEMVSISDISKNAGKSNGAFYNYFKNKEEIYLSLLDDFLHIFEEKLKTISGETIEDRLDSFLKITIATGKREKKLVSLFREGQYRYCEMEQRLKKIYEEALYKVYKRELSESEYLFATGPVRFISIRSLYHKRPYNLETLKEFILRGLYPNCVSHSSKIFTELESVETIKSTVTKEILLETANNLFGESGYHKVNIYDITRISGFAVGTFYRHYESKESILKELVEKIGSETLNLISENMERGLNPLEQTIRGFYIFLKHMEKHPAYYKIVREAEFVLEKTVEEYYNNFEEKYINQKFPDSMDKVTLANALSGIGHYFGIEDIFTGNITDMVENLNNLTVYLKSGIPK